MSSSSKRRIWIYATLAVVVLAFVGISVLPLVGGVFSNQQAQTRNASGGNSASPEKLAARAQNYQRVLEREPQNVNALQGLVQVRLQQGKLEQAVPLIERLAQANPEQTQYRVLLAQAKQRTGDIEGAIQAYRQAVEAQPGNTEVLRGLVALLLQQDRAPEVIDRLQQALDAARAQGDDANVATLQLLLGQARTQQLRYEQAVAAYDRAIVAGDESFRPFLGKALALRASGQDTKAKSAFQQALSRAPENRKERIEQLMTQSQSPQRAQPSPEQTRPDSER